MRAAGGDLYTEQAEPIFNAIAGVRRSALVGIGAAGAQVPEGLYINVSLPTRFSNSAQPVRELVSFRLDEDQVWRVSGYSIRTAGN